MKITKAQYHQLVGLMCVAENTQERMNDIVNSMRRITQEEDKCGHTMDAAYGSRTLDELLDLWKITVGKK